MIFDWLNPKAWLAGLGAAALVGVSSYGLGRVHGADRVRAKWNEAKVEQSAVALKATKDAAAKQVRWIDNTLIAANERTTHEAATADLRARLTAAERRLRDHAAARGGGVPAPAADACGQALAAARRDAEECRSEVATLGADDAAVARERESRYDELRELMRAWPKD